MFLKFAFTVIIARLARLPVASMQDTVGSQAVALTCNYGPLTLPGRMLEQNEKGLIAPGSDPLDFC
jgi:hypothetical protein